MERSEFEKYRVEIEKKLHMFQSDLIELQDKYNQLSQDLLSPIGSPIRDLLHANKKAKELGRYEPFIECFNDLSFYPEHNFTVSTEEDIIRVILGKIKLIRKT